MSISFAEVTDITIPEGSVERITETVGGRVLWEKKMAIPKMHWEFTDIDLKNTNIADMRCCVDTGDGVEIFTGSASSYRINGHFKYYPNGTVGDLYTLWRGSKIQSDDLAMVEYKKLDTDEQDATTPPVSDATWGTSVMDVDIDPITNKWVCCSGRYYASNAFSVPKWQPHNLGSYNGYCVCWSPKLKLFCIATNKNFYLVDTNGNIKGVSEDHSAVTMSYYNSSLIWSASLEKFIFMGGGASQKTVYTSSNGLKWESYSRAVEGNTSSNVMFMRSICWIPSLKKFVGLRAYLTKFYMYVSDDGIEWQYLRSLSTKYDGEGGGLPDTNGRLLYSPERRVLLVTGHYASYLTRDLENWVNMPYIENEVTVGSHVLLGWSKTLNAFLLRWGKYEEGERIQRLGKLVIDN